MNWRSFKEFNSSLYSQEFPPTFHEIPKVVIVFASNRHFFLSGAILIYCAILRGTSLPQIPPRLGLQSCTQNTRTS